MASLTAKSQTLEQLRKQQGVSLQDIAASTKISIMFLEAIEHQQFSKLPGGVFNRSYLRQYAAAAGIAESHVIGMYDLWESRQQLPETHVSVAPRRTFGLRWIASALFAAVDLFH